MFRAANPRDIGSLLRFAAQAAPDLAHPLHRLGASRRRVWVPRVAVSSWLPKRGRTVQPLLLAQGRELRGLVVLRGLRDMAAWEIDHLLVGTDPGHACAELLARADVSMVRARAERVFLRLSDGDEALAAANETGYRRYKADMLFGKSATSPTHRGFPVPPGVQAHWRRQEDEYPLFRLCTASSPVAVRAAEGPTFREWRETIAVRSQGLRKVRDTVFEAGGQLIAWLRTGTGHSGQVIVETVIHPDHRSQLIDPIVSTVLAIARDRPLFISAPVEDELLASAFGDAGFQYHGTYFSLVHQIRERVTEGVFMPVHI